MRFDVYVYIRYKHKLRIDVITYVPTLANDPSAAVCLSVYYTAIIVAVPAVPGIPTSQHPDIHQDIRSTTGTVYLAFWWWIPAGIPRWICGMGSVLIIDQQQS